MAEKARVLFVCVHNAGRSRMAAAYLNALAGDRYEGVSAGTEPADHPHPEVVTAMAEEGIDLGNEPGTMLTFDMAASATRVIGMGCAVEETCPALQVPLEDWGLDDPKGQPPEKVRAIRDDVRRRVERLVTELDETAEHHGSMRWAGDGSELWHVRVDLIAPDGESWRVSAAHAALMELLTGDDGAPTRGFGAGVDQGIGVEGQPVIGLTFWVRADDEGAAAVTALATARAAASADIAGPAYYDVVLVPRSAVIVPPDEHEIRMAD